MQRFRFFCIFILTSFNLAMNSLTKQFKILILTVFLSIGNTAFLQDSTAHLYFDGVNDYVETHNTRLDYVNDDFTFEAIIKGYEDEQGTNPTLLSNRWSHIKGVAFYLKGSGDGPRALCFLNRGEEWYIPNNGAVGSLLDGECHHVAVVRNDGNIYFYSDGVEFGVIYDPTCVQNLQGFNSIWIGRDHFYDNPFKGVIGNVRIWDVARTEGQISENMYVNMDGYTSGLRGSWPLNEGIGQHVYEATMYGWSGFLGVNSIVDGDYDDPDWFSGDYCAAIADYGTGDDDGWVDEEEDEDDEEDGGEVAEMVHELMGGAAESVGIATKELTAVISIYPNPNSSGSVTVDLGTNRNNVAIVLSTLNGQEISTTTVTDKVSTIQLNVDQLAAGIYLLIIRHESGSYAEKLVIE